MKMAVVLALVLIFTASQAALAAGDGAAQAVLVDSEGKKIGVAVLIQSGGGVQVAIAAHSLPAGIHAVHIHEAGVCEGPDFKSAGGHFNPFGKKHGLKSSEGPHAGDIENIEVRHDGYVAQVRTAPLVTLAEGKNSLFQPGGTSIVIHEKPDDYSTDPAGAAGARIACGVITRLKAAE